MDCTTCMWENHVAGPCDMCANYSEWEESESADPLQHPAVQAEAEKLARELHAVRGISPRQLPPTDVDAFHDLLTDLDRPATRDHWIRWAIEQRPDRKRELEHCRNNPRRLLNKLLKIDKEG
jgi:hypothetical protein